MEESKLLTPRVVFGTLAAIAVVGIYFFIKREKKRQFTNIKVLELDIKQLEHIKNDNLILNLFTKACESF